MYVDVNVYKSRYADVNLYKFMYLYGDDYINLCMSMWLCINVYGKLGDTKLSCNLSVSI